MAKVLYFLMGMVLVLGMSSCLDKQDFPDEPIIKFNTLNVQGDSVLILNFSFTDGDGNFGFEDGDTLAPFDVDPFKQNLIVTYFEKQDGVWQRFGNDFLPFSPFYLPTTFGQRVPLVEPTGQRLVQEGEIEYKISEYLFLPNTGFDTARFEFFIYDRDLNASNTETTSFFLKN